MGQLLAEWARGFRPLRKTGLNFWRRRETRPYPEQKRSIRFQPALIEDQQGRLKCVACHLCESACPTDCLEIEAGPLPEGEGHKGPVRAELDLGRCLFCGDCVLACPEGAIELQPRAGFGNNLRSNLIDEGASS